jgi:2-keto-4-pentenoate hydratase/2-oxohepta-3-ene-1,7-dioic acid hydratase in catechol pathway
MAMQRYGRALATSGPFWFAVENGDVVELDHAPWLGGKSTGRRHRQSDLRLLAPVEPTKILCVGRNYRAHAAELGHEVPSEPLIFLKPPSSVLAPGGTVELPPESRRVDHEGELGIVIASRCRRVPAERALERVFGYTIVCDVTARDLQKRDGQWTRAKGFDGFCPVGPWIVRGVDASALGVRVSVDGELRQDGNTRDMIFDVASIVAFASNVMTLEPGDLIATGTPEGVGPIAPGSHVAVSIDELGTLEFTAAAERG